MRVPRTTLLVLASLTAAVAAHAGAPLWVHRTSAEFAVFLDVDGDGDNDLVVADRATGLLRVGRRTGPDSLSWESPVATGLSSLDGFAAGRLLPPYANDTVAAADAFDNRVVLLDLTSAATARVPHPLFPRRAGPHLVVALDALSDSGDELFVTSDLNGGTSGNYRQVFAHASDGTLAEAFSRNGAYMYHFAAAITPSNNAPPHVAALAPSTALTLFGTVSNAAFSASVASVSNASGAQFIYGFFAPGSTYGQILAYTPGTSVIKSVPIVANATYGAALGTTTTLSLPAVPNLLIAGPATNEVTLVTTNGTASVYTFNGSAFTLVNTLAAPVGSEGAAFLALLTDRATGTTFALLDTDGDGRCDQTSRYGLSGNQYVALSSAVVLPMLDATGTRVTALAFKGEPLVDSNATRIAAYTVSDWSSSHSGVTPSATVYAHADRGAEQGLSTSATAYPISGVPTDATHILVNQLADDIAVSPLFTAAGESFSALRIVPDGGTFDAAVHVRLTAPDSVNRIYYRLDASAAWTSVSGTSAEFWIYKDNTLQCYGYNTSNGRTTPISSASFSFTCPPDEQDSDGDGVPDFVELQYGLDPTSGQDADGDGLSDLDELLGGTRPDLADSDGDGFSDRQERAAGTNPRSAASKPTTESVKTLDANSLDANERQVVFDLHLGLHPFDGYRGSTTTGTNGVPCTITGVDGSLLGSAETAANGFPGLTNPSLAFRGLPLPFDGLVAGFATPAHFAIATTNADKVIGRELVKLVAAPPAPPVAVTYIWNNGAQATEAAAWTNAARVAYTNAARPVLIADADPYDTLVAALFEAFAGRELSARSLLATNTVSLFPVRAESDELLHPAPRLLLALQTADAVNNRSAYNLTNVLAWLRVHATVTPNADVAALRDLTVTLYSISSTHSVKSDPGRYALPFDALRQVIRSGTLPGSYTNLISSDTALSASKGARSLFADVPPRTRTVLSLRTAASDQAADVTVLTDPTTGLRYSLVEANGDAYGTTLSLAVPTNSTVRVDGFLNGADTRRGADLELEVVSLTVSALAAATPTDRNANLIPDDYEMLVFGAMGAAPDRDADGDGFSDLQEYLEHTNPSDASAHPSVPAETLRAPEVTLMRDGDAFNVQWNWPARYQSRFDFIVETTDDLQHTPFAVHATAVPQGDGDTLRCTLPVSDEGLRRFYRVRTTLR